jgi:hypothetical protein
MALADVAHRKRRVCSVNLTAEVNAINRSPKRSEPFLANSVLTDIKATRWPSA